MGEGREVIFEFRRLGHAVKVTATDARSLVEVSIVGSARASAETLKRAALDKLDYVLRKRERTGRPGAPP
jgi:hypothetical protein